MTYSIAVFFDEETEQLLRQVWRVLAQSGLSDALYLSNNRPHITLSIYKNIDLEKTIKLLCSLACEFPVMDVSFRAVAIFPNTKDVFLMPSVSVQLMDLEQKLRNAFAKITIKSDTPYFLPGEWTPHCSMANDVRPDLLLPIVQKVMNVITFPLNGKIIGLGLTSYPPVNHLHYCPFTKEEAPEANPAV